MATRINYVVKDTSDSQVCATLFSNAKGSLDAEQAFRDACSYCKGPSELIKDLMEVVDQPGSIQAFTFGSNPDDFEKQLTVYWELDENNTPVAHITETQPQIMPGDLNKPVIVSVRCINSDADDVPEYYTVNIDNQLAARIRKLSALVEGQNEVSIKGMYYGGCWSDKSLDPAEINEDESNVDGVIENLKAESFRIDLSMLVVTKDKFYFMAVPKHCGDNFQLTTNRVPIKELTTNEAYIDIE